MGSVELRGHLPFCQGAHSTSEGRGSCCGVAGGQVWGRVWTLAGRGLDGGTLAGPFCYLLFFP